METSWPVKVRPVLQEFSTINSSKKRGITFRNPSLNSCKKSSSFSFLSSVMLKWVMGFFLTVVFMSWSKWFSECFYQFVDQDITTARTTHSQDRDYILSSLLVILSWEIAWPYEENRKRECQANIKLLRPGGSYVLVHKLIEAFWEPFGPGHEDYYLMMPTACLFFSVMSLCERLADLLMCLARRRLARQLTSSWIPCERWPVLLPFED